MTKNEIRLKLVSEGYVFCRKISNRSESYRKPEDAKEAAIIHYDNTVTYWRSN